MHESSTNIQSHWQQFYRKSVAARLRIPSQFAVFVASEFPHLTSLIEYGCGTGRDTEFFADLGFKVLAFDSCPSAIEMCKEHRQTSAEYVCCDAASSLDQALSFVGASDKLLVYARFFLHAITLETQQQCLSALAASLPAGSAIALEYRTTQDEQLNKAFGSHYRRYIDHDVFQQYMQQLGFALYYEVTGFGMAKYRAEDAHVGRYVGIKA
jgi:tellurite methyltransferase